MANDSGGRGGPALALSGTKNAEALHFKRPFRHLSVTPFFDLPAFSAAAFYPRSRTDSGSGGSLQGAAVLSCPEAGGIANGILSEEY
jgi:hypothetical protein